MTAGRTWQGKLGGVLEWIWGWHWMALPRLKNVEHIQWHHLSIKAGGLQTAQQGTQPRAFEPKSTIVTVKKVTLAQSHISTHRHRQTQPQTDSHTHTQTHTDTHTHTHRHTDTHKHKQTCLTFARPRCFVIGNWNMGFCPSLSRRNSALCSRSCCFTRRYSATKD